MEIPKKIYLVNDDLNTKREWYKTKQVGFDTTEYICADTFIEKAAEWIKENLLKHTYVYEGEVGIGMAVFLEEFKQAMKGE